MRIPRRAPAWSARRLAVPLAILASVGSFVAGAALAPASGVGYALMLASALGLATVAGWRGAAPGRRPRDGAW